MAKLMIGADLVPTKSNTELFQKGDAQALVGPELLERLQSADYRLFNLEMPLTDTETPIPKSGPNLLAPTAAVRGYKALGVDFVTLANNHILDQGGQGVESTLRVLDTAQIAHAGAGEDLAAAQAPHVFSCGEKQVGIYCCAEHEFTVAGENAPGANPFDPLESLDHVARLKECCDYVIVLYHGGREHYRYPSPHLQRVCRKLVERGADLVVCQHSHCIGCEEQYKDGIIVYGQGNFLFDHSKNEVWQTGLLLEVDLETRQIGHIPLEKTGSCVRLAQEKAQTILEDFRSRSAELREPGAVEKRYAALAEDMERFYLEHLSGIRVNGLVYRVLNKLTGGGYGRRRMKKRYGSAQRRILHNFIRCEAHQELLLKITEQ